MVTLEASFPGPRVGRRAAILRECSTTVLEMIATVTAPVFHSPPGDADFLFRDRSRWGSWQQVPRLFGGIRLHLNHFGIFLSV